MHGSATVGWLLVALCAVTGISCVLRARGAEAAPRADAAGEAVMGFAMAAMAVPALWHGAPVPTAVPAWGFAVIFGALLAWETRALAVASRHGRGQRSRAEQHGGGVRGVHAHHLVGGAAMLYMSLAMALPTAGGTGTAVHHAGPGGVPAVTGVLLAYFAAYVIWTGTKLVVPAPEGAAAVVVPDGRTAVGTPAGAAPSARRTGLAAGCRLAMATGTFVMLLTL